MKVEILPAKRWWQRCRYRVSEPLEVNGFIVPEGFVSDGASIPQWLSLAGALAVIVGHQWSVTVSVIGLLVMMLTPYLPVTGKYLKAAFLHDYLLEGKLDRSAADKEFLNAMKSIGVAIIQRYLLFASVSLWTIARWLKAFFIRKIQCL
jgi:hypothetical protein